MHPPPRLSWLWRLFFNPRAPIGPSYAVLWLYSWAVGTGSSHGTATASSHGYIASIWQA